MYNLKWQGVHEDNKVHKKITRTFCIFPILFIFQVWLKDAGIWYKLRCYPAIMNPEPRHDSLTLSDDVLIASPVRKTAPLLSDADWAIIYFNPGE